MLKLDHVTYHFKDNPMSFSFSVAKGERLVIVGPSGAGKSTLLSLIAGFLMPDDGRIWLDGNDQTFAPPSERPVSILFQENNLFPHLTLGENIALGLNNSLRLTSPEKEALSGMANRIGLGNLLNRLPSQVSGGQAQRAALARCLLRNRPILLLDEPLSALDPALRNDILHFLKETCDERHITLLMVSHNLEDAIQIAPRALLIDDGKIAYDGNSNVGVTTRLVPKPTSLLPPKDSDFRFN